ncbi:hypothetical protein DU475_06740 [Rhodopseudomonas sp. WA056]|nr:hypothetical protein [Rhodopseudomonas sp. WA056]
MICSTTKPMTNRVIQSGTIVSRPVRTLRRMLSNICTPMPDLQPATPGTHHRAQPSTEPRVGLRHNSIRRENAGYRIQIGAATRCRMVPDVIALMIGLMIGLKRFVLLGALWLALTSNDPAAWPIGIVTAAAVTMLSLRLLPAAGRRVRLATLIALAPGFLTGSLRGGIDVARRAFDPRLPLSPGWLAYLVRLPSGAPRAALGGELSLMPGTLTAGEDGRALYVHCLDLDQPHDQAIATEERRIGASLGLALDDRREAPS